MNDKMTELCRKRDSIVIFRNLGNDEVVSDLMYLIDADSSDISCFIKYYSDFVESLYKSEVNLSEHLLKAVLEDENFYISGKAQGKVFDSYIVETVENELKIFQEFSRLTSEDFISEIDYKGFLPKWRTSEIDFVAEYRKRIENINRYGYGKYSRNKMFILRDGKTVPVKYPDKQKLSELYGYERERKAVIENTLALINGKKSHNVLLYGDAGTGKSSTVKAVVNEFSEMGLRLVEITKEQLREIPVLIDELSANPLKFIIFIDDLSFTSGEDCFGALKAVLEGSVSSGADNIAIYATSNRRHLIKENFSDREGDDIHKNDTMQEMLSLSARFGLRVNFSRPDKKSYTAIAIELAKSHGINLSDNEIILKAEQFALSSGNGRSPRTVKQFINQLIMEM